MRAQVASMDTGVMHPRGSSMGYQRASDYDDGADYDVEPRPARVRHECTERGAALTIQDSAPSNERCASDRLSAGIPRGPAWTNDDAAVSLGDPLEMFLM